MELHIGKPYNFRDFNCWHYVATVRKENGIKTKMFKARTKSEAFEMITAQMSVIDNGVTKVDTPQDFDIVLVESVIGKRKVYHCGLYYDKGVAHCDNVFGSVRYQPFNEFIEKYEAVTFWR